MIIMSSLQLVGVIILTLIIEQFSIFIYNYLLGQIRYRRIVGKYTHDLGTVIIKFKNGKRFKTKGTQTDNRIWEGEFLLDGKIGTGYYKWKDKNDWGHHELYFELDNKVSATWINKSDSKFNSGNLLWIKTGK